MTNIPSIQTVELVRQYLDACGAGEFERAYAMLSTSTQEAIGESRYKSATEMPAIPDEDAMSLRLVAISALFIDAQGTVGFRHRLVGPSPGSTDATIVEADPPAETDKGSQQVHIVTVLDDERGLVIDMYASMERTDPEGVVRAKERAAERAEQSRQRHEQLMAERAQQGPIKPLPE